MMKPLLLLNVILFLVVGTAAYGQNRIEICKSDFSLCVINAKGDTLMATKMAYGVNSGPKMVAGDHKTPEGSFHIKMIYDSRQWHHDFKDGKGQIYGCYGPYFMRLDVPGFNDIGIHGTHLPESIGTQATEGCIRLTNEDITRLYKLVRNGTAVRIRP